MHEDSHARVRRFTLTGLESPEELWDRLRESTPRSRASSPEMPSSTPSCKHSVVDSAAPVG